MNPKERIRAAVTHREPDVVPWQISFTQPAWRKLQEVWGAEEMEARLGNHIVDLRPSIPGHWLPSGRDRWVDEFGVTWNRSVDKDIGNPEDFILSRTVLDEYKWPDPHDKRRYENFARTIDDNTDRFIMCSLGFSLFERAWTLRGMEQLLIDMVQTPEFVEELLERIVEFNLAVIDEACRFDIDGFYTGDDWGQQHGLLMGPLIWRRFIKPCLKRMYGRVKEHGKLVFIHSCGDVREIFPDLIEIGVDVFNPFQPEVMDVRRMKREYGRDLCFWGGVSIQQTLPYGTPDDVRSEVRGLIRDIGAGGGYIISPAHDIPGDVPVENIVALVESIRNQ